MIALIRLLDDDFIAIVPFDGQLLAVCTVRLDDAKESIISFGLHRAARLQCSDSKHKGCEFDYAAVNSMWAAPMPDNSALACRQFINLGD
ncbi:hypothetical protein ASE00_07475 [Sphingomonas sp. Root710]|uniref:hypothetical protein n=1 Tax=Sphingomonas sp. Root710 TaxID=1736594 RepID=UPI0006FE4D87|nr:hypothetical protein [Sphingomonas sp. Root710]KRB86530.1 hypothetical protein ASE00_07475 [Sphingomonas sp. Root710]